MRKRSIPYARAAVLGAMTSLPFGSAQATDGHILHGVASINQSMGGAGIATSIDAIGSNFNNVSSISFLARDSVELGAELFIPDRSMSASTPFASGTVDSKTREAVIPNFGLAYKIDQDWTFGFTALGVGGFGVDYPANQPNPSGQFNPLATPQQCGGFGSIYSNYQFLQMTPSIAYRITPDFSIGLGYNLNYSTVAVDPWPARQPNASGYPSGSHTAMAWGVRGSPWVLLTRSGPIWRWVSASRARSGSTISSGIRSIRTAIRPNLTSVF